MVHACMHACGPTAAASMITYILLSDSSVVVVVVLVYIDLLLLCMYAFKASRIIIFYQPQDLRLLRQPSYTQQLVTLVERRWSETATLY